MKLFSLIAPAFARDFIKSQSCADPDANADHVFCRNTVESIFSTCVGICDNDASCISACSRDYVNNYAKCPCMDGCPDGCPCQITSDEYQCPSLVFPMNCLVLTFSRGSRSVAFFRRDCLPSKMNI